jgi:nucleotide-binding universal stress UspA family protein
MSGIVVGTDGSEGARAAVLEAARLAKGMQLRMVVVSAYGPSAMATMSPEAAAFTTDDGREAAEQALRLATEDLQASGVEHETRCVCGGAAESLVDVAKLEEADTIVVGSRGMRGPRRLLGSVPNAVSHRAPCSVLIVRTD